MKTFLGFVGVMIIGACVAPQALSSTPQQSYTEKRTVSKKTYVTKHPERQQICRRGENEAEIYPKDKRDNVRVYMGNDSFADLNLRDGRGLVCNTDVVLSNHIAGVRYGNNRDLHALAGFRSDGAIVVAKHRLQDGKHHDVWARGALYHITYGRKKDITRIFKFNGSDWCMVQNRAPGDTPNPVCGDSDLFESYWTN